MTNTERSKLFRSRHPGSPHWDPVKARAYHKLYRQENPRSKEEMTRQNKNFYAAHRDKIISRYRKKREEMNRLKMSPCVDCGVQYNPWVMQFDHRDPSSKKLNISRESAGRISKDRLMEEIKKCDLVCANCHMERTHCQRQAKIILKGELLPS